MLIEVKLVRSLIGSTKKQKACIKGLGLTKKINCKKQLVDSPEIRGMIKVVSHMVEVNTV